MNKECPNVFVTSSNQIYSLSEQGAVHISPIIEVKGLNKGLVPLLTTITSIVCGLIVVKQEL